MTKSSEFDSIQLQFNLNLKFKFSKIEREFSGKLELNSEIKF